MADQWHLKGDYFENCNCKVSCPCTFDLSAMPASADESCNVMLAFNVTDGSYGGVDISGLRAALVILTPPGQPMGQGNARSALYIDERASASQEAALQAIFSGQAGGLFGMLAPLVTSSLGVKKAPISFEKKGNTRTLRVEGVVDVSGEAFVSPFYPDQIVSINGLNLVNPNEAITQAVVRSSSFHDHGLVWDNTGKNAYIASLDLKGP